MGDRGFVSMRYVTQEPELENRNKGYCQKEKRQEACRFSKFFWAAG